MSVKSREKSSITAMPMNGLRRKADAIENHCWYQKKDRPNWKQMNKEAVSKAIWNTKYTRRYTDHQAITTPLSTLCPSSFLVFFVFRFSHQVRQSLYYLPTWVLYQVRINVQLALGNGHIPVAADLKVIELRITCP